ncbi:MAG: FtsQ-type POTRA domain-containing protein [Candidatus Omnitrophica bacterium]|nr:FtsQ-type POTRA domain-containing protein [Candidatus Omnitrophota bacterium]
MARKSRFKAEFLYIFIAAIVVFFIVKYTYGNIINSEYFIVKNIEMIYADENNRVTQAKTILPLKKSINIFNLDLKKCQRQIEASYPEIKNVRVHRNLPDKITVVYQKRVPFCQVKSAKYYLVSEEAVVLPGSSAISYEELPVVVGIYISESRLPRNRRIYSASMYRAIQLIGQIKTTDFEENYKIKQIDIYDEFNPVIYLENGIQIKMGTQNFTTISDKLEEVLADLQSKGLKPKAIDMRFDDIVVTPK